MFKIDPTKHKWLSPEGHHHTEIKELKADIKILILIIIILITGMITVGVYTRIDKKKTIRKVNSQWIAELDKRGLIYSNNKGSFKWRSNK